MKTADLRNRYPGIRAFETEEKRLFFGRRNEIRKFYSLVKSKPLVVFFAKSGIGKSSLINAGLIPLLQKKKFQAIKIRLQNTNIPPTEAVKQAISGFIDPEYFMTKGKSFEASNLWECMRACKFRTEESHNTPVLIFDQFEEFFDHSSEAQEELTHEIADLVSGRLPIRIQEELRAIPRKERIMAQNDWYRPFEVKVVFAIRSDRIHQLDEMSDDIPIILHERYHLKALNYEQAREAIIAPALLESYHFETDPFHYGEQTLQNIITYLSNKNNEIEPFQLQLICQHIEKKVKELHG